MLRRPHAALPAERPLPRIRLELEHGSEPVGPLPAELLERLRRDGLACGRLQVEHVDGIWVGLPRITQGRLQLEGVGRVAAHGAPCRRGCVAVRREAGVIFEPGDEGAQRAAGEAWRDGVGKDQRLGSGPDQRRGRIAAGGRHDRFDEGSPFGGILVGSPRM